MATKTKKLYSGTAQSYIVSLSDTSSDLATGTNIESFRFDFQCQLSCVFIEVDSVNPPTGSSIIVDINYNGVSIFETKPTISASESKSADIDTFEKLLFNPGDELTFDIDQIGSSTTGKRLKAHLIVTL